MKINILFSTIILTLLCHQASAQSNLFPPNEPGKCYAKCLMQTYESSRKATQTMTQTDPPTYSTQTNCGSPKPEGFTEWKEVVCEKDIDSNLVNQINETLLERGYTDNLEATKGRIDRGTIANLVQYQKDNKLPIGQLDIETLRHLGIEI